jgi:adenylate cyclase
VSTSTAVAGFWEEIKRRKVFRLALIYVVVGWIVIQAADIMLPALGVPEWGVSLVVVLVLLGFPAALVLSWMFDVTSEGVRRTRSRSGPGVRSRAARRKGEVAGEAERSIAVLPFLNMSDDPENEYFSDGMTEEILNALVKVDALHVASRTSSFVFKGKEHDVRDIADRLGVETVLEGSVRKAGSRIRITAQLIDAGDGYHIWSDTYDRELKDVFQIQDEIARAIVDALKLELVGEGQAAGSLVHPDTQNVEAYNLYLKGRFFYRYNEVDLRRSLELYEEALTLDPSFGRAYAGIADTWMQLADDWMPPEEAYPKAKTAAERAIRLDEGLAEAHTALGKVLGWFEWNFDGAELALRRAVASNPKYGDAHWGLASILPATGRLDEGVAEMRTATGIDPLHASFSYWLGRFLMFEGRYDDAITESRNALELDANSFRAWVVLGQAHLSSGREEEALEAFTRAGQVGGSLSAQTHVVRALAAMGRTEEASQILTGLTSGDAYVRSEYMAAAWGALGDLDRAFQALDEAHADRSAGLIYLHVDPSYLPLRGDPRYASLVEAIGLKSG